MNFITMGSETDPVLLFIHGLSGTAESCYGNVARNLKNNRHIVLCELDGHYDGSRPFSGITDACEQIERYVLDHFLGKLHGMIRLSLGGTIAVSLFGRGKIYPEKTVLDAAYCVDMGLFKGVYTWSFPLGVARVRDGKPVPGFAIDMFLGKGNRSLVNMLYPGITIETCRIACREIYSYRIPEGLGNTSSAVEFWRAPMNFIWNKVRNC